MTAGMLISGQQNNKICHQIPLVNYKYIKARQMSKTEEYGDTVVALNTKKKQCKFKHHRNVVLKHLIQCSLLRPWVHPVSKDSELARYFSVYCLSQINIQHCIYWYVIL